MKLLAICTCLILVALFFNSCSADSDPPSTVSTFDKKRYAGVWHEIARLPNTFEDDLIAAKATYGVNADGTVSVHNEGLKEDGETTSIKGTVKTSPSGAPGQLTVRFDKFPAILFSGDYWILDVNQGYTQALVGSPDRKFLWLLSKDASDQTGDFTSQIAKAKGAGFDTEALFANPKRITR